MATARTVSANTKTPLLPPEARNLLHRAARRVVGVVMIVVVAAVATALFTYVPTDPSLNTAAPSSNALNALGFPGAVIADLILQTLGAAAAVPLLVAAAWGIRLAASGRVSWLWLRTLATIAAAFLMAMGLSAIGRPDAWPIAAGLGGFSGTLLLGHAQEAAQSLGVSHDLRFAIAGVSLLLGTGLLIWATSLRIAEVRAVLRGGRTAAGLAANGAGKLRDVAQKLPMPPMKGNEEANGSDRKAARKPRTAKERAEPVLGPAAAPFSEAPPMSDQAAATARRELVAPPAPRSVSKRDMAARQGSLLPDDGEGYRLPPLDLLGVAQSTSGATVSEDALAQNARLLEGVLSDFGVNGEIVKVRPGPVVTLYELEPAPGTKTSRVVGLADDIARSMSAVAVRIAVVPGRSVIGIELPNARREVVNFRELLAGDDFHRSQLGLALALGRDIGGSPVSVDLSRMPHLLIAGTTGSGKSVAVNTMICSLLYRLRPEDCRFIMIDPKMLELSVYDGIPHLLTPVVTDPGKAVVALKWAVKEMENRYRAMSQMGVRNIAGYNQKLREASARGENLTRTVQTGFDPETGTPVYEEQALDMSPLPFIVVIVDEMADLMLVAGKDVEAAIQRLAQMARAAGIHIIMATQRPSVDVITGTIKANFPTRISFQVTSKIDSRTILGEQGAEQLLGQGDMLYMAAGGRITRVHGPFVSDSEVESVVAHIRSQGEPAYLEAVTNEEEQGNSQMLDALGGGDSGNSGDTLFDQAVALVARERKASTSFIQRHLQIGYNRAARIIEQMETEGMVSRANHVGKREVLLPPPSDDF